MSTIVLLDPGSPELEKTLGDWGHQIVPMSLKQLSENYPPQAADLLLVDRADEHLQLIEALRLLENRAEQSPFPIVGIGWTQVERWPAYQAGFDACLNEDPELLQALLPCPQIWAGYAFDAAFALKTMGHSSIVEQMIEVFLAETPHQFKELQAAHLEGDNPCIARAAHRFGGGLAIWGQIPALRATLALETAAENSQSTEQIFQILSQTLGRLLETLDHLCDSRASGLSV